jgi:hypothetical protein
MKKLSFLLLLLYVFMVSYSQVSEIERKLFELPDVIFKPIDTPEGFESAYELSVKQPIDHKNPQKGYFYQKVYLSHRGFDRPVVFVTEGYEMPGMYPYELTPLLNANQVDAEHRYFGNSIPDALDYTYLTTEQEADDLHHINELLKTVYPGKWVTTGISKGGQTSIYYRYYFPSDVDVSVPYVAPVNLSTGDERIYTFFDTVNTNGCRDQVRDFQKRILRERNKVLPLLQYYSKGKGLEFTYLTFEQAFEYTVLEYSFSFWQWGHKCSEIPPSNSTIEEAVDHLLTVSDIDFFSDATMNGYKSHYYQAGNEVGYYSYRTDDFKGLLKALPLKPYPSAVFPPDKMKVKFDPSVSKKIYDWSQTNGNNMIYIYGAGDTWSATSIPVSSKTNSLWFFVYGANHRTARIRNFSPAQRTLFINTLEKWLGTEIE